MGEHIPIQLPPALAVDPPLFDRPLPSLFYGASQTRSEVTLSIDTGSDGVCVVRVYGDVDLKNAFAFYMALHKHMTAGGAVVIDTLDADFFGGSAVAVLINLVRDTAHTSVRWAVTANTTVLRMLDIADEHGCVIARYASVAEAVAALSGADQCQLIRRSPGVRR